MPRQLPSACVETLRVAFERDLESDLRCYRHDAVAGSFVPASVPLTEALAPRVHRLANEVATTLGATAPFALFQTRDPHDVNAQALWREGEPFGIRLIGSVVSILDDAGVRAVLGHEFGHYLAHGPRVEPPVLDPSAVRLPTTHPLRSALQITRELTADRFALLACRVLDAAVRVEVVSETGLSAPSLGLRELDHLAEVCEQVESGKVGLRSGSTHPSREFRLFATWLFWRSDVFQNLTGLGPGDLSKTEIDSRLAGMLTDGNLEQARRNAILPRFGKPTISAPVRIRPPETKVRKRRAPAKATVPAPSGPSVLDRVHAFTDDVRQSVQKLRTSLQSKPGDASTVNSDLDEPDDIEARFRQLERANDESNAQGVDPELERRFRELEEQATKKPS